MRTQPLVVIRGLSISGVVILLAFLGACESSLDKEDRLLAKSVARSAVPAGKTSGTKNRAPMILLGRKLQPYVKCINTVSSRISSARDRYLMWIKNKDKGPTCKERVIYGTYKLYTTHACTTDLLKANKKPPRLPKLEKASLGYAAAVLALKPLLDSASTYYSTKAYKNDGCAKGKALHPKLMAAWERINGYDHTLRGQVRTLNRKIQAWQLDRVVKRYGKKHPRYFHRKVMAVAKKLLAALRIYRFSKKKTSKNISDVKALAQGYDAILKKMDASAAVSSKVIGYSSFKSAAKKYQEAVAEFIARVEKKKRYTRMERRWMRSSSTAILVKGSFPRVLQYFNRLVGSFNRVRFP